MQPKAAVLAIGTELTNGQITNRNSSWISGEILKLGFESLYHRSVPDDRELIHNELQDLSQRVELLFVTGGLGPTTDDFTRDCIARFLGRPMLWDEKSWNWIVERMAQRQLPVRDNQKQQCYYPEGAQVLWNKNGTAHGFLIEVTPQVSSKLPSKLRRMYVLPGPPAEVDTVFQDGVKSDLQKAYPEVDALIVRSWDCLGFGESEVASRVEAVLEGCPFDKGYRVHLPLVEFKLSYPASKSIEAAAWLEKIEKALGDIVVLRNFETAAGNWVAGLANFRHIEIQDSVTDGEILKRVVPALALEKKLSAFNYASSTTNVNPHAHEVLFCARHLGPGHAEFFAQSGDLRLSEEIATPANYLIPSMEERRRQYLAESALLAWTRLLSQGLRR